MYTKMEPPGVAGGGGGGGGGDIEMELKGKNFSLDNRLEHVIVFSRNVEGNTHKDQHYSQLFSPRMSKNIMRNLRRRMELCRYDEDSDQLYFAGKQV